MAPPLPLPHTDHAEGSLSERIALAEQRLVEREQTLRQGAQALVDRARRATEPSRLMRPALYALGALAVVWGALRLSRRRPGAERHGTTTSASGETHAAPSASPFSQVPWARAAALLWPLLPVAWRGRMGADNVSLLVAMGVPLMGMLFSRRPRPAVPSRQTE